MSVFSLPPGNNTSSSQILTVVIWLGWYIRLWHRVRFRVGNFQQKIIPRKTEQAEQLVNSDGIPAIPRNAKLSEFRSEPFQGWEKCSEFRTVAQKLKQNSRNSVPNHSEEKTTRNSVPWNRFNSFANCTSIFLKNRPLYEIRPLSMLLIS